MNNPVYTLLERNISIQLSSEVECPISDFLGVIGTITKAEEINVCYWLYSGCVFGEDIAILFFKNKFPDMSLNGVRKIILDFQEQHPIIDNPDTNPIDCNRWDLIYGLEMIEIPTPFSDFGAFLPLSSWASLKQYLYVSSKPNITNVRKWVKDYNTTLNSNRWTSAQMQTIASSIMVQLGLSPNKFYFSEENVAPIMISEMENEVTEYLPEIIEDKLTIHEIKEAAYNFDKVMKLALQACEIQLGWISYVVGFNNNNFALIFNRPRAYQLADGGEIIMCESCERACAKLLAFNTENFITYNNTIPNIVNELKNWFTLSDKELAKLAYSFIKQHPIFKAINAIPAPLYYRIGAYTMTYKGVTIHFPEKEDKKFLLRLTYEGSSSSWNKKIKAYIKKNIQRQYRDDKLSDQFIEEYSERYIIERTIPGPSTFNIWGLFALAPFLYLGGALVWLMIGLISMAIAGVFAMIF